MGKALQITYNHCFVWEVFKKTLSFNLSDSLKNLTEFREAIAFKITLY